ncbi:hypothetical protein EPUL_006471, partial [Erysiphe pulchra]
PNTASRQINLGPCQCSCSAIVTISCRYGVRQDRRPLVRLVPSKSVPRHVLRVKDAAEYVCFHSHDDRLAQPRTGESCRVKVDEEPEAEAIGFVPPHRGRCHLPLGDSNPARYGDSSPARPAASVAGERNYTGRHRWCGHWSSRHRHRRLVLLATVSALA